MLEYRFHTTSDLDGHALGNLILTSLLDITGSLKSAIEELSILLDVKSKILPLTEDENITLMGEAIDGDIIEGEEMITKSPKKIKRLFYKEEPHILNEVIEAINEADLILFKHG